MISVLPFTQRPKILACHHKMRTAAFTFTREANHSSIEKRSFLLLLLLLFQLLISIKSLINIFFCFFKNNNIVIITSASYLNLHYDIYIIIYYYYCVVFFCCYRLSSQTRVATITVRCACAKSTIGSIQKPSHNYQLPKHKTLY